MPKNKQGAEKGQTSYTYLNRRARISTVVKNSEYAFRHKTGDQN
jgi:hypothetical protein